MQDLSYFGQAVLKVERADLEENFSDSLSKQRRALLASLRDSTRDLVGRVTAAGLDLDHEDHSL